MFHRRICRTAGVTLAVAAMAAPAASAMPVGDNGPVSRGLYEPVPPAEQTQDYRNPDNRVPEVTQNLQHPDTRDYAEGRGTYNAPEVVVVSQPAPKPITASGIDWEDVGIGAGGLLGIVVIGAGGALILMHRRTSGQLAS
jgi:hypothetical protein